MNNIIAIGGDHAGYEFKQGLISLLASQGLEVKDFGPFTDASVDYPDYVHPLCKAMEEGEMNKGIIICGSGNGVAITANKYQGIRAAICWNTELALLSRQHNDANLLALPARFIPFGLAQEIVKIFLSTDFEGGRHQTRVNKIPRS